jgi:hypothetical protein
LRNCVEALTTLHFEVDYIQRDARTWFQGDLFNMGGVRKFYQFQSRLMQNGFTTLFGAKLQELHLKLTFALVNCGTPGTRVPDVIGAITRAQASAASAAAANDIAQIGSFVCNSQQAQFQENGILRYARAVTELDVRFLEEIREDICLGMDAFDIAHSAASGTDKQKLLSLSTYLLSILERVAERLDTFYARLARESIYRPELESNPARTRWNLLRRKIGDGSFFILAQSTAFTESFNSKPFRTTRYADQDIVFAQVISQAQRAVDVGQSALTQMGSSNTDGGSGPLLRLADSHTARAASSAKAPSSFESQQSRNALQSISGFMNSNKQSIKRLSQLPSGLSYAHVMATYCTASKKLPSIPAVPESQENAHEQVLHQRQMTPSTNQIHHAPHSGDFQDGFARRRGNLSGDSRTPIVRRATNASISSAIGLPQSPAPSAQSHASFVGKPIPHARTATSASSISSEIPLPLRLTARSRSRSRTRFDSRSALKHRSPTPTDSADEEIGVPGPAVQSHLIRRKMSSASSLNRNLIESDSTRSSPLAGISPMQGPNRKHIPAAAAQNASQYMNDRLLAQMQYQNKMILQTQGHKNGSSVELDRATTRGLRALKLAPAPAFTSTRPPTRNAAQVSDFAQAVPVERFRVPLLPLNVR